MTTIKTPEGVATDILSEEAIVLAIVRQSISLIIIFLKNIVIKPP